MATKKVEDRTAKQKSIVQAYKNIFESPEGQVVLLDLMRTHNVMNTTIGEDSHKTYFKEGERNVVLRIMTILKWDMQILEERIKQNVQTMV